MSKKNLTRRDVIDAVIDTRARRRCQLERRGTDPVAIALHLLIETGDAPGWDSDLDDYGWDTAA